MVNRDITLLNLLYPTPRVGTQLEIPYESSIGIILKVRTNPSNVDPLAVIIETHTPKLDSLIEGLRIDEYDDKDGPGVFTTIEPQLKSSLSKLASQCREISTKLIKYANDLEHASKKQITGIDEKLQRVIKEGNNSSQHGNPVSLKDVNQNHVTSKSSIPRTSSVSSVSSLAPNLSLFE